MDLADAAGLSLRHVNAVERCEREPSLGTLGRLARALGVDAAELFRG